jgi:hypothetical protein
MLLRPPCPKRSLIDLPRRSTRVTLERQPSSPPGRPLGRVLSQRACRRGRISYDRALILALAPRSSSGPGGDSNLLLLWCRSAHRAIGVDHQRTVRANSGPLTSQPWRVVIRALRKAEQTFRVDVLRHPKLPISMSEQVAKAANAVSLRGYIKPTLRQLT